MAFDEGLAARIRDRLDGAFGLSERKMFGGLAFMFDRNMAVGIIGDELMVRVGPDLYEECLRMPHARKMDFTGRSMRGFVFVSPDGFAEDDDLDEWLELGENYARSLPPK